jgi:hypothetical protein
LAILLRLFDFLASKYFKNLLGIPLFLALSVPGEGYSKLEGTKLDIYVFVYVNLEVVVTTATSHFTNECTSPYP